jgi:subtilisin family serine protease
VYGWNFVTNKANPDDDHGHGTHVAGIIGAVADLRSGVSGVAHHVSIMAVKYYSDSNPGSVNLRNTVRALNYAIDHGAQIINYSGGGPEPSEDEYLALKRAEAKGFLVVSAAGNEHQNTDLPENKYYPAAYRLSNMISVAATDIHNKLLASSNWGRLRVDVAAPGENIYSTLPGGRYGYMSGTSQATAFVSGEAALLLSQDPSLTPVQIKEIIMSTVDRFPTLAGKLVTGGRVNAYAALLAARNKSQFRSKAVIAGLSAPRKPAKILGFEPGATPASQ